jgi:Domain of unknown function (DUF4349)
MTSEAILTELRALPGAPDRLRERVRALPEPKPRIAWTPPRVDLRRTLLVLAPAVVALGVGAAALHGVLAGGGTTQRLEPVAQGGGSVTVVQQGAKDLAGGNGHSTSNVPFRIHAAPMAPLPLPPSTTRLNRYEAWLRVKVARDDLAQAATRAMQIARGYGGYVVTVDMNTPGARGRAFLVLRVPVTKVEDAVLRLGKLGAVTSQHVRIQDLQRQANVEQQQILNLRTTIAKLEEQLQNPSLSAADRFRLEYALQQAKRSLTLKTTAHAGTIREGTLATVSATFYVPQPKPAAVHHEGRIGRTLKSAGSFLVRELAWLLYALIVVGPIAVLAALGVLGARAGRRRADRRLLESA